MKSNIIEQEIGNQAEYKKMQQKLCNWTEAKKQQLKIIILKHLRQIEIFDEVKLKWIYCNRFASKFVENWFKILGANQNEFLKICNNSK